MIYCEDMPEACGVLLCQNDCFAVRRTMAAVSSALANHSAARQNDCPTTETSPGITLRQQFVDLSHKVHQAFNAGVT